MQNKYITFSIFVLPNLGHELFGHGPTTSVDHLPEVQPNKSFEFALISGMYHISWYGEQGLGQEGQAPLGSTVNKISPYHDRHMMHGPISKYIIRATCRKSIVYEGMGVGLVRGTMVPKVNKFKTQ